MSRSTQTLRQTDVKKAVKAVTAAGLPVSRVEIAPDGRIIVIAGQPEPAQNSTDPETNEWDSVT